VVKDLRKTMEMYHQALGWGPWNVYEHKPPLLHSTELRGKPTPFTMLGAEVQAGPIGFELLQPLDGPSIYKEWLEQKGEGLHHLACMHARRGRRAAPALRGDGGSSPHGRPNRRDHPVLLP